MSSKKLDELTFENVMDYLQKKYDELRETNEKLDKELTEIQKIK